MVRYLIVAACGILLSVALPPTGLWPFALALVPLFIFAADSRRLRDAFWLGFTFALPFFALYILWLPSSFSELLGPFFWALFPPLLFIISSFWGVVTFSSRLIGGRGRGTLWLLPALWVLMEWARTQGYFAFPWGTLGYLWLDTPIAQMADLVGVYGLSLLSLTGVALLASLFLPVRSGGYGRRARNTVILPTVSLLLLFGASLAYGLYSLRQGVPEPVASALLVQGNTDPFGGALGSEDELAIYSSLSRDAAAGLAKPPDLVIWPEGTILTRTGLASPQQAATRSAIQGAVPGTTFIIGSDAFEEGRRFNSAYSLTGAQVQDRFDKRGLVPFGERWPLIEVAAPLYRTVFSALGLPLLISTSPGDGYRALETAEGRVAAYICYESVFPHVQRAMVKDGAEVLVNITNDAWFGQGDGALQHFEMGRLRAIETRRYLLRAGVDGVTALVDPRGRVTDALERGIQGSLLVNYGLSQRLTPFVRFGNLQMLALAAYTLMAGLLLTLRRGR